jgi:hypothetical protein
MLSVRQRKLAFPSSGPKFRPLVRLSEGKEQMKERDCHVQKLHSGIRELFTNDCNEAFRFKTVNRRSPFVADFADALLKPQVLDHP